MVTSLSRNDPTERPMSRAGRNTKERQRSEILGTPRIGAQAGIACFPVRIKPAKGSSPVCSACNAPITSNFDSNGYPSMPVQCRNPDCPCHGKALCFSGAHSWDEHASFMDQKNAQALKKWSDN